jgi:hypothetical protein
MNTPVDFHLRDYLSPGGKYPYAALAPALEAALAAGQRVYLWSVPRFFMLAGHPGITDGRPWSDGTHWYKTAADAIRRKGGKR